MGRDERELKKLVSKHDKKLKDLKSKLPSDLPSCVDELFMLRFLMAVKGNVGNAVKRIDETLKWRAEKAAYMDAARSGGQPPKAELYAKYLALDSHKGTKDGDLLFICRSGLCDAFKLMEEVTQEELTSYLMYRRELLLIECDKITNATGRLTKVLLANDMYGVSAKKMCKPFMEGLKSATRLTNQHYPQLISRGVMLNPPGVLKAVGRGMKFLTLGRAGPPICKGDTRNGDPSKCSFLRKNVDLATLPTFLGGKCECPEKGGCVKGFANNVAMQAAEDDGDADEAAVADLLEDAGNGEDDDSDEDEKK